MFIFYVFVHDMTIVTVLEYRRTTPNGRKKLLFNPDDSDDGNTSDSPPSSPTPATATQAPQQLEGRTAEKRRASDTDADDDGVSDPDLESNIPLAQRKKPRVITQVRGGAGTEGGSTLR